MRNWKWKEATNELTSLVSTLNPGSEIRPIEEYVHLAQEEIIDAKYRMVESVEMTWERELHFCLDLIG